MHSHPIVKCTKPLAANASAAPLDVVKMKSALGALGHYQAPEWGVSQFPDAALFDAIKRFQKSQGLKVDGAIKPDGETEAALSQAMTPRHAQTALQATAQALQSLGRGGDELLAHITKEEAALLHRVTDGATINPQTGLLEFFYGGKGGYTGPDHTHDNDSKGDGRASFDASADHKANQGGISTSPGESQKEGSNDHDNGSKTNGDDGQGLGGNATGGMTGTKEKEGTAQAQSDKTRTRRASAKEDSLPGDVLGGDGLSKKDDKKADNPPGYNPDETIEDVETQFKDQLGINPDGTLTNQNEKKAPGRDPKQHWKPGMPPATSFWNGGVKVPSVPQANELPTGQGPKGSASNPERMPDARYNSKDPSIKEGAEWAAKELSEKIAKSIVKEVLAGFLAGASTVNPAGLMLPGTREILDEEFNKHKRIY